MEERRSHTIEITILSAENLCMNGKPVRKNTNVVVHTPQQSCTKFFATRMTEEKEEVGRSYPSWNEKFLVELASHGEEATWITLEVQCKTWLGVVRSVGATRVAVSDVLGGFAAENNCLQLLSYRLWDTKGERNGIINFSVRVVKAPSTPESDESSRSMQIGGARRMMNVESEKNLRGFGMSMGETESDSNGVVTGIPVLWNYPANIPR